MDYKPEINTFPHKFSIPDVDGNGLEHWEVMSVINGDDQKNERSHYEIFNINTGQSILLPCENVDKIISESKYQHNPMHVTGGAKKSKRRQTKKSKRRQTKKSKRRQTKKSKRRKR